mmetsp:Transcript_33332/g.107064  ORF Transcript_33332/g.107064 Transcript_33332/m.107064 type:complete len:397 (+) Transcript_33332:43-1233(+)
MASLSAGSWWFNQSCSSADADWSESVELSSADTGVVYSLAIASASVSLCGSLFVLFTFHSIYGCCGRRRSQAGRAPNATLILYWMSISDVGLDLFVIVDSAVVNHYDRSPSAATGACGGLCAFLGGANQFFSLAVVLWTGALAANMVVTVLRRPAPGAPNAAAEKLVRSSHLVAWGTSGTSVLLLWAVGGLGSAGLVCWISDAWLFARFLLFYLPLLMVLGFTAWTYSRLRTDLKLLLASAQPAAGGGGGGGGGGGSSGGSSSEVLLALSVRFARYVTVFALVWTFPILLRAWSAFARPPAWLSACAAVFSPLQGLGNALIYGFTPSVREHYRNGCLGGAARRTSLARLASSTSSRARTLRGQHGGGVSMAPAFRASGTGSSGEGGGECRVTQGAL